MGLDMISYAIAVEALAQVDGSTGYLKGMEGESAQQAASL